MATDPTTQAITSPPTTNFRSKHDPTSNRFPKFLIPYSHPRDTTAASITTNDIRALSNLLPCIANPMPVSKPEKPATWKYQHPSNISDLSPTALSHLSTHPSLPPLAHLGCIAPSSITSKFMQHTPSTAKATNANARITAGLATDIATSFDPMVMARTAALCDALGAPNWSLHTHHRTAKNIYPCAACGTITSAGFSIPAHPATAQLRTETSTLRAKIYSHVLKPLSHHRN